ncbi:hypothetical protein EJ06DRAFT_484634 [Trichodelitschia bisporula]|uniref:Uncharacterized protein n=1 Tax=Trichodelitschia bisporula TaxID=703511 RepID=A0A6G1HIM7_9PEZI|nr:hypothetical protein EJ06DRAFT_484634 [Trichodelitschia bisporula]
MTQKIHWRDDTDARDSEESSRRSDASYRSYSTAPTERSERDRQPGLPRRETCHARLEGRREVPPFVYDASSASVDSVSTIASDESDAEQEEDDFSAYEADEYDAEHYRSDALPASPLDFSELFPSARRLVIHHDDSTVDGNMNLRIDTSVELKWSGKKRDMTLFHLRMHDLKSRHFSLRRYCRDSGREVCSTARKYQQPATAKRPPLQKSFSSAFATLRRQTLEHKAPGNNASISRQDSGYGSLNGDGAAADEEADVQSIGKVRTKPAARLPTNTIKLEFSNYAHVNVKRRGTGANNKRYQFEYWGHQYSWKRCVRTEGHEEEVSYHLVRDDKYDALAHIVPVPLTTSQVEEERFKGGWVPPCSMWISDQDVIDGSPDLADVVMATGLIALVDDTIKRRWHSKHIRQIVLPLARSSSFRMEYIGPKQLINEVFHRSGAQNRGPTSGHPSPIRRHSKGFED